MTVFFSHSTPIAGAFVLAISASAAPLRARTACADSLLARTAVLGVMFVSFAIHLRVKPYREDVLDRLEVLSMSGSLLTLWLGLFFHLGTPLVVEVILTIVICVFNALLCAQFGLCIVQEVLKASALNSMPAGARQEGGVSEDALSEYIILFWWVPVAAMPAGPLKKLRAFLVLRFIQWAEQGRRTAAQIRADIPETLLRVRRGAVLYEYKRRAENAEAWARAGLVTDTATAAWLCAYEGRGREPESLAPLIDASCERAWALEPYLQAAQAGCAERYEMEHASPAAAAPPAAHTTLPPPARGASKRLPPPAPMGAAASKR